MSDIFSLDAYDYDLPSDRIAQHPANPPDSCKLLIYNRLLRESQHAIFSQALSQLGSESLLFFNDSKVLKARIPLAGCTVLYRGKTRILKEGELFYLQPVGQHTYQCYLYPGNKMPKGSQLVIDNHVLDMVDDFEWGRVVYYSGDMFALLDRYGQMPLPPYIQPDQESAQAYQPIVSRIPGSVASPTASLHFTDTLLATLQINGVALDYVTLHVGVGTFRPIESSCVLDHPIHYEQVQVDIALFQRIMTYKLNGKQIIAVGTTSCRTLESLVYLFLKMQEVYDLSTYMSDEVYLFREQLSDRARKEKASDYIPGVVSIEGNIIRFSCQLYIVPGFPFLVIDQLITNFHLPKSSLMVLVAAYMGYKPMMDCYKNAIQKNYMFYSFGDAMWIQ